MACGVQGWGEQPSVVFSVTVTENVQVLRRVSELWKRKHEHPISVRLVGRMLEVEKEQKHEFLCNTPFNMSKSRYYLCFAKITLSLGMCEYFT